MYFTLLGFSKTVFAEKTAPGDKGGSDSTLSTGKKTLVKMFVQKSKLTWTEAKAFCAKQDKMELASRDAICPGGKPFDAPESNTGLWVPINGAKKEYMYYAKTIPNLGGAGKDLEACMTHASWPAHKGATAGWADNHSNDKLKSFRVYCQMDYFEANKGDGGKGGTPSTGYGSKVLSQSDYQKKDVSDFLGVKIERDNAVITMGEKGDIKVFRNAPKQIVVDADFVGTGDMHIQGQFTMNGQTLQAIIAKAVDAAVAPLLAKIEGLQPKKSTLLDGLVSYYSFEGAKPYVSTINGDKNKFQNLGSSASSASISANGAVGKCWRRGTNAANAGGKASSGLPAGTTKATIAFFYRENDFTCHRVGDCAGVVWLSSQVASKSGWTNIIGRGSSGSNQDISLWSPNSSGKNIGFKMQKNEWAHLVLTSNSGKDKSGKYVHDYKMYANGKLVFTRTSAFAGNIEFGPDYYFMHYFSHGNGNNHFARGDLDEIGTWNRALSADEVSELYDMLAGEESLGKLAKVFYKCTPCPPGHVEATPCDGAKDRTCVKSTLGEGLVSYYSFDGSDAYKSNVKPTDKWANIGGKGTIKGDGPIGKCWSRASSSASAGGARVNANLLPRTKTASVAFYYRENDFTCHRVGDCAGILWFSSNFVKEHGSWQNVLGRGSHSNNQELSWWSPNSGGENIGFRMEKNKWTHIVVTSEGGVKNKYYVNGKLKKARTAKFDGAGNGLFEFGPDFFVENYHSHTSNGNNHFARGDIDELAAWNRVLTEDEVGELYGRLQSGSHIFDLSLGAVECLPCPDGEVEKDPCSAGLSRTCENNGWQPLKDPKHWTLNEGNWKRDINAGTIRNTGAPGTWLTAGWTGRWHVEKNVAVTLRELSGGGGGGGGTNWGHPGLYYHYEDNNNWEGFYFRPHSSGSGSAIQFICNTDGKTKGPAGGTVSVPTNGAWMTASVKVTSKQAILKFGGKTFTYNRCVPDIPGGVGVMNHQSLSEFKDLKLCSGANCKL